MRAEQDGAMPKKLLFLLTLAFVGVLVACNKNNDGYVLPAATPTPFPTATAVTLEATYKATPLPGVTINMYASTVNESATPNPSASATAAPQAQPTGPVLQSQVTAADGTAVFSSLTPGVTYCWAFNYVNGNTSLAAHNCTSAWGYGTTLFLGT